MEKRTINKESYPEALREIPKAPEELFMIGQIPEGICLGVVGTRKFSHYGKEACEKIISELAVLAGNDIKIVIVSGLALGIDSIAHKSAMANGLKTIAVPGSGLDPSVLYPKSNLGLAKEIVERGGALLTEFTWDLPPTRYTFPQRNRIIAGLSRGVLVVEAPEKSGSLITANFALEFNRDVFALPGSIFSENSRGANKLIQEGAIPVTCGKDILRAWDICFEEESAEEKTLELSGVEAVIWEALREPAERDVLIRTLGISAGEASAVIAMMELDGLLSISDGIIYRRS